MAYIVLTFFLFTLSCFGQYPNQTITTDGDAQILVAPDQVEILAGIETNEVALTDARNENSKRARAILAPAKKLGVADGDSKTDFFALKQITSKKTPAALCIVLALPFGTGFEAMFRFCSKIPRSTKSCWLRYLTPEQLTFIALLFPQRS